MSWDSVESSRQRASVVGEWELALTGPSLLCLRRSRRPQSRLILRGDGTADWPGHQPPDSRPLPPAPFPTTWRLSDDWVLTIARPVPPMPEYGQPDWFRESEDFRVLEASGGTLALTCGDVFMVFCRDHDAEYERWMAAGAGTGTEDADPGPAPDRRGT